MRCCFSVVSALTVEAELLPEAAEQGRPTFGMSISSCLSRYSSILQLCSDREGSRSFSVCFTQGKRARGLRGTWPACSSLAARIWACRRVSAWQVSRRPPSPGMGKGTAATCVAQWAARILLRTSGSKIVAQKKGNGSPCKATR